MRNYVRNYICMKACTLNGTQVNAGEIIPHEMLVENRIPKLISMGYIQEGPTIVSTTAPVQDEPKKTPIAPSDNTGDKEAAASVPDPIQNEPEQVEEGEPPASDEKPLKSPPKPSKREATKKKAE